ncbi:MAG: transcriptional regulator [bacterium]|nr:MAG: transcriptional regulator [bacterium]
MVDRIKSIMAYYRLRAAQFSDAIGMQRSAVSHVLSGRNKPSLDFVLRIKNRFPEISLDWLTLGKGSMIENDASLPVAVSQNLFSKQPAPEKTADVVKKSEDKTGLPGNTQLVAAEPGVKDEETASYGMQKADGRVVRVLFVYNDDTFSEYKPRK